MQGSPAEKWRDLPRLSVSDLLEPTIQQLRLTSTNCDAAIIGNVRGPDGQLLDRRHSEFWIEAFSEPLASQRSTAKVITANEPHFAMKVQPGRYSVGVSPTHWLGAQYGWYTPEGVDFDGRNRAIIEIEAGETASLDLILPFSRSIEISGRVVGVGDQPLAGVRVSTQGPSRYDPKNPHLRPGWIGSSETTATTGEFGVPFTGTSVGLLVTVRDCRAGWFGADGSYRTPRTEPISRP